MRFLKASTLIAALTLALGMPAHAQVKSVEILWSGLLGAFADAPPPGDPLPDVDLRPWGKLPRPILRTDRIPGRAGVRFGILFNTHAEGELRFVHFRHVVHYPQPGRVSEISVPCLTNKPCYAGFVFQDERDIVPGAWRMELFLGERKLHEAAYFIEAAHK